MRLLRQRKKRPPLSLPCRTIKTRWRSTSARQSATLKAVMSCKRHAHDTAGQNAFRNLRFLSFSAFLRSREIRGQNDRSVIGEMEMWLGAESNRRHVDFQSTALPTELPSRCSRRKRERSLCRNPFFGQGFMSRSQGTFRILLMLDRGRPGSYAEPWYGVLACRELKRLVSFGLALSIATK